MQKNSKWLIVYVLLVIGLAWGIQTVLAGSVIDYGQLLNSPARANYVAWYDTNNPPNQVLTEDGFNSASGVDQGYQGGIWRMNPTNFAPAPGSGATMQFVFGGLGVDSGTIWVYSYLQNNNDPLTEHGTVGVISSSDCPVMLPGSWDGSNKLIRWSAPPGIYLIYKSVNPSGASNGNSNGRYSYLATVSTTTNEGSYTDTAANVESWHIVIPADDNQAIIGCHSEESNPTAVNLKNFSAATQPAPWLLLVVGIIVAALSFRWVRSPQTNWLKRR